MDTSTGELAGKNALITGASSGIGRATALRFAQAGASVAAVARRLEALEQLAADVSEGNGRIVPIGADLATEDGRAHAVAEAERLLGGIDVLVNAAGILEPGSLEAAPLEHFDRTMNVNVRAVYDLTRRCLPDLVARHGNVVNVSSVAGPRAFPNVVAYCVSKAALDQFTRCVALELAPQGVRVNAVNPGVVETNLHRAGGMDEEAYRQFLERSVATHPLGRAGTAEEVADLILFLASDRAGWITATTVAIDGGRGETCAR